jgi:hypothetical protein
LIPRLEKPLESWFPCENSNFSLFSLCYTNPFPESGKHIQDSGIRAPDSPHKITPKGVIFRKKIFEKITTLFWVPLFEEYQKFAQNLLNFKTYKKGIE